MSEITILDDVEVTLLDSMGDDSSIIQAAQVSHTAIHDQTRKINPARFIGALVRQKHGSPFEHNSMKFRIKAPIFVFREFMRHRIGFSYNEISGRYAKSAGEFYIPKPDRPMVAAEGSTSMKPAYEAADPAILVGMSQDMQYVYEEAWFRYETMLANGIAKEMARSVLPVGMYSEMVVTCNARSLMAFLALRTSDAGTSYPQHEIELVAKKMESIFAELFPETYVAFQNAGRVAP